MASLLARIWITLVVLAAPAIALAQDAGAVPAIPTPDNVGGFASAVLDAIRSKNWGLLAALIVLLVVWGVRKFGGNKLPFLASKLGGLIVNFVASFALAFGGLCAAGATVTAGLLLQAAEVAFLAAGGWSCLKTVIEWWQERKAGAKPATPPSP